MWILSAIIILPDGTVSNTQIVNFAQINDWKLRVQTNPPVNMEIGAQTITKAMVNGELRFHSHTVIESDGEGNFKYSKMERILPDA